MGGTSTRELRKKKWKRLPENCGNLIVCDKIVKLRDVKVVLHKIRLDKVNRGGPFKPKLNRKPIVKLKKIQVPAQLLSELKRTYSPVLRVHTVRDEETEMIKEAVTYNVDFKRKHEKEVQTHFDKKPKKLKVSLISDSQIVDIKDSSKKRVAPQVQSNHSKPADLVQILSVSVVCDTKQNITFIRDSQGLKSGKRPIIRIDKSLRYLKPSKTVDDYGLGGRTEIDRDDVDNPIKQIPLWAQEKNYLQQMSSQSEVDPEEIFASCGVPDLEVIFSSSSRGRSLWDTPPSNKYRKIQPEKNGNTLQPVSLFF